MGQHLSATIRSLSTCTGARKRGRVRLTDHDEESAPAAGTLMPSVPQANAPKPIYIAVLGLTGSGKTTFVNLVSESSLGVGRGLESCTSEVQASNRFNVGEREVVLIDTPGFGDTTLADSDIWKIIAASFVTSYRAGIHFTGVIYMQRISDVKVSGSSQQSFRMFQELCGEETYPNVLLVTSMWDTVTPEVGTSRDQELATKDIFFKPVLEKGAKMMRHDNTRESALGIIRNLVDKPRVTLRIQRELGGGVDIMQTSVYRQIRELMLELVAQRQKKLDTLMEELAEAERDGDEETQEELQEEVQSAKAELQDAQDKTSKLANEYQVELQRIEEMLRRRRSGDADV
ncbi:P-loop containing nucleoside triphosphate hydrolase protein [Boletus reticuloceps]|uniref:P-loop containing nucleoside triphosphate hydrolase protein n=1 Tax=Boletus reticuloceps TaxID=495285 RepID=A0A8I2YW29_9AGAM|nr:P-loop containing nucleoside triphosphate hydrolase protein [Boletus reticuloceps]